MSHIFTHFFTDFHFIRPWWLLALPLGLILLAGFKRREPGQSQWHKVCDQHLLEQLLVGDGVVGKKRVYSALLSMLILVTLALSGPTWERLPQPLYQATEGRVIVLDLSMSMAATDISPSRLTRARYKAIDLIKAGAGIEQGLVVFAGDSFIVAPLTDDQATLLNLLPSLSTDTVPVAGSRADRGLKKALELLQRATISRGQIILIADDANQEAVSIAKKIQEAGHRIDVIAVGTKTGAPVALPEGGYLKNSRGEIVVPVPDFAALEKVADSSGGSYLKIDSRESAFKHLNQLQTLFPEEQKESKFTGDQWLDRGPWLLIPLLLLAALSFRKGWLLLLFLTLLLPPKTASAFTFKDLWQRPEQQAAKAFNKNDYERAANFSRNPDWQAAALYRAGKFKEAAAALESRDSSLSHYNRGNALAKSGDLKQALAAYDKALAIDPEMTDAQTNRDLVEKLLKKQEQKQQEKQQKQDQSDDNKKSDQDKKSDQEKSDSQESDSEKNSDQQQQGDQQQADQKQKSEKSDNSEKEQQQKSQSSQEQKSQESESESSAQEQPNKKDDNKPADQVKPEQKMAAEKPDDKSQDKQQTVAEDENEKPLDAKHQALEQWLRRVPDDPGGLLERKFRYQYRDRKDRSQGHKEW